MRGWTATGGSLAVIGASLCGFVQPDLGGIVRGPTTVFWLCPLTLGGLGHPKVISFNPTLQGPRVESPLLSRPFPRKQLWRSKTNVTLPPIVILPQRDRETLGGLRDRFICGDFQNLGLSQGCVCV